MTPPAPNDLHLPALPASPVLGLITDRSDGEVRFATTATDIEEAKAKVQAGFDASLDPEWDDPATLAWVRESDEQSPVLWWAIDGDTFAQVVALA